MPNKQGGGTIANFEEKVPPQDVYLVLVMYDNLTPRLHKIQKNPTLVRLFRTPRLFGTAE